GGEEPTPAGEQLRRSYMFRWTQNFMNADSPDLYEVIGTYPPYDARLVVEAILDAGVRYTLDPGKSEGDQTTAFGAAYGGANGIAIGVHTDDLERAISIRNRVLKIQV